MKYTYDFPRPSVTTDAVVFGIESEFLHLDQEDLSILLIKRKDKPHKGRWALPGGFVHMNESLDVGVLRELKEETCLKPAYMEQLATFGAPKRDPRGRVITVAYIALVKPNEHKIQAKSDAKEVKWHYLNKLPKLAFDHAIIVETAVARLRAKVRYAPIGFDLLPDQFSLVRLQNLYELILGRKLDKRNFRKKILNTGLLNVVGKDTSCVPHASLYSFNRNAYKRLTETGFNFEI